MKRVLSAVCALALAFSAALPYAAAQEEGPDGGPEAEEAFGEGPEMGGPGMRPGMGPGMGMGPGGQAAMGRPMRAKARKAVAGERGERMALREEGPGEEETLAIVKKHDAAFHSKLAALKDSAPAKYRVALRLSGRAFGAVRMEQDPALEKDAVRLMALEYETRELSLRHEKAAAAEKAKIKTELKGLLGELFDLRLKAQELRVKRMEADLGKLKAQLEKRKASRAKLVQSRLDQMTGEAETW